MSASVTFDIIGRDRASSALSSVGREAEHSSTMLGRFGRTAAAVFTGAALYNGARDLLRLGEGVAQLGGGYVTTLNQVQAISRSSSSQINANAAALEGQASEYAKMGQTASDAADGELELTKAGLSLKSAYAAVLPTMTLAKSGQLAVGDAATLVSNTLNAYHLKAKQAVDITNEIANAADISSADVTDLAESFKYVSPLAAKSGVDLAQTNAVLAELANSGVKASQAGTSFRKFLLSIQAPSKAGSAALDDLGVSVYNADGKMRPLVDIIGQFQQSLGHLTQEQANTDLKAIFGLTGLTGATILIKGGTQALDRYSRGVAQAGGASRLAQANSKGLAGTLSMLKAEAETGAEAFYRKYSPAVNDFLQNAIGKAKTELPVFVSDVKSVFSELEPTFESLGRLAVTLGGDFKDLATSGGGSELISALRTLNSLTKSAADFLNGLPEPVRKVGIEVGIAALVFPTFAGAVNSATGSIRAQMAVLAQWRAEMSYSATRAGATSAAMTRLGGAASAAAGVAGMALLIDSTHHANQALNDLESVAGGAALGFAVGGPLGAGVGALGGALLAVSHSTNRAKDSFQLAAPKAADFADTLNKVSGAATAASQHTAYLALQQSGAITAGQQLGITSRDLVKYVMGNKDAIQKVTAALKQSTGSTVTWTDQYGQVHSVMTGTSLAASKLSTALGVQSEALTKGKKAAQEEALATGTLGQALQGVKDKGNIVARITTDGYPQTARELADLISQYSETPKQISTLVKALGIPTTVAQVQNLINQIHAIPTSHTTTIHTVYDTQHHGPTGNPQAQSAGGAGRSSTGYGGTPLAYALHGLGRNSDGSDNGSGTKLTVAAAHLLESIVKGIDKGKKPLANVLSQVESVLKNRVQNYQRILSDYQSLQAGFSGFTTSIFATQGTGTDANGNQLPASLQDILTQSAGNFYAAQQLAQDVATLQREGLSAAILRELESQGSSGAANLHTLATQASLSDIAQLNSNDASTTAYEQQAGTTVANAVDSASLKAAKAAEEQARTLKDILAAIKDPKNNVTVTVNGQTIVAATTHHKKHHPDA